MPKKWEDAHVIVKKIRAMNFSKDSLERILGVLMEMLMDGGSDLTKIDAAGKLILVLRQPNGDQAYLDEMKKLDTKLRKGCVISGR